LPIFFNTEKAPATWCDYFQKADLARQYQNWEEIAQLGDAAFGSGKTPNHPSERIPFIEGYAHVGAWEKAEKITLEAPNRNSMFCAAWARIQAETAPSAERKQTLSRIKNQLNCDF
jgi:hypothetical protein